MDSRKRWSRLSRLATSFSSSMLLASSWEVMKDWDGFTGEREAVSSLPPPRLARGPNPSPLPSLPTPQASRHPPELSESWKMPEARPGWGQPGAGCLVRPPSWTSTSHPGRREMTDALTVIPGGAGAAPVEAAALDAASGRLVDVHGVLHDDRHLGLQLRVPDALLEEPCGRSAAASFPPGPGPTPPPPPGSGLPLPPQTRAPRPPARAGYGTPRCAPTRVRETQEA